MVKMAFKEYNTNINFLLPPSYRDFLWDKHPAIILNDIVESLDLSKLENSYKNNTSKWWASAYHPKMLLKIIIYAYMNWIFSSRKIHYKTKEDIAFMFLAWNQQPDFRTINSFRKDKLSLIEDIFYQIVKLAMNIGIVKFGVFSIDWTKIYANASKYKNIDETKLEEKINELLEEAERIDKIEDEIYWEENLDAIPDELADKEIRKQKIKEELEKMKKAKKDLEEQQNRQGKEKYWNWDKPKKITRINLTDKDSRLMQMKRKDYAQWYNCQIVTENQFIIWTHVSNNPSDQRELIPTIKKINRMYKQKPEIILADKWYPSEENFEYLEKEGIKAYIPVQRQQINLEDYEYDKEKDEYKHKKTGLIYRFKQYSLTWRMKWRPRKWEKVVWKKKIYVAELGWWKRKYLELNIKWKRYEKEQIENFKRDRIKSFYKRRTKDVEASFWDIKSNIWFEKFLLRWLDKVKIEWNIVCLAHNFKKLINFMVV